MKLLVGAKKRKGMFTGEKRDSLKVVEVKVIGRHSYEKTPTRLVGIAGGNPAP